MDNCGFCLGGETDVPPFGTLEDAKDIIAPCQQCSFVAHRKCLYQWFDTLPDDKIKVVSVNRNENSSDSNLATVIIDLNSNFTQWFSFSTNTERNREVNDFTPFNFSTAPTIDNFTTDDTTDGTINDNSNVTSTSPLTTANLQGLKSTPNTMFLLASCPQCKHDIVFTTSKDSIIGFHDSVRSIATGIVQFGGLALGVTSAITGVVSMSYIGLTTCGLKFMECLLPRPMLAQFLSGKYSSSYSNLSQLLLSKNDNYSIDNLEQALLKGLVDPFKFSRIPILPIILYKMRSSSFTTAAFGNASDNPSPMNSWFTELMITGYISSLGDNELVKAIGKNLVDSIQNPSLGPNLLRGINLWRTNNMIAMLIPARWAYDLFYRLTFNIAYFDLTLKVRPRDIPNNLSESQADRLEELNSNLGDLQASYLATVDRINSNYKKPSNSFNLPIINGIYKWINQKILLLKSLYKTSYFLTYLKYKLQFNIVKFTAIMKHDFSPSVLYNSWSIRWLTTMIWPYVSSKVGSVIFEHLLKKSIKNVPQANVLFLSNIIGLAAVVFAKDLFNLGLSYYQGKQFSKISVKIFDSIRSNEERRTPLDSIELPGRYPG